MNTGRTHFKKGQKPWNAGKKGIHLSPQSEFKKGDKGHLGYKHSEESKLKMRISLQKLERFGENSPNWRGGSYPLNMLIRRSQKYREWRKEVFERDKYKCVSCGDDTGGNLEADHIETFASLLLKHGVDSMQSALICADLWSIANGRTLCISCHKKTDTFGAGAMIKMPQLTLANQL